MASSKSKQRQRVTGSNQLRIIGGQWRSRKLEFQPAPGLRPTSDRIRETLFNWLAPTIHGARCLDLFAGSGALGLEALSRGATHCDFIDTSSIATRQISAHLGKLNALERGSCHSCRADHYLNNAQVAVDIVFIDPPFGEGLIQPVTAQLHASGLLAAAALIYIEAPAQELLDDLPQEWLIHRQKISGGVSYTLLATAPD